PALASTTRHGHSVSKRSLRPSFQRTRPGLNAGSLQIYVCVRRIIQSSRAARLSVVGLGGLEPPASPLSGVRSNHLSYRPKSRAAPGPQHGGACRDRTDDPLLAKQVLS